MAHQTGYYTEGVGLCVYVGGGGLVCVRACVCLYLGLGLDLCACACACMCVRLCLSVLSTARDAQ